MSQKTGQVHTTACSSRTNDIAILEKALAKEPEPLNHILVNASARQMGKKGGILLCASMAHRISSVGR